MTKGQLDKMKDISEKPSSQKLISSFYFDEPIFILFIWVFSIAVSFGYINHTISRYEGEFFLVGKILANSGGMKEIYAGSYPLVYQISKYYYNLVQNPEEALYRLRRLPILIFSIVPVFVYLLNRTESKLIAVFSIALMFLDRNLNFIIAKFVPAAFIMPIMIIIYYLVFWIRRNKSKSYVNLLYIIVVLLVFLLTIIDPVLIISLCLIITILSIKKIRLQMLSLTTIVTCLVVLSINNYFTQGILLDYYKMHFDIYLSSEILKNYFSNLIMIPKFNYLGSFLFLIANLKRDLLPKKFHKMMNLVLIYFFLIPLFPFFDISYLGIITPFIATINGHIIINIFKKEQLERNHYYLTFSNIKLNTNHLKVLFLLILMISQSIQIINPNQDPGYPYQNKVLEFLEIKYPNEFYLIIGNPFYQFLLKQNFTPKGYLRGQLMWYPNLDIYYIKNYLTLDDIDDITQLWDKLNINIIIFVQKPGFRIYELPHLQPLNSYLIANFDQSAGAISYNSNQLEELVLWSRKSLMA